MPVSVPEVGSFGHYSANIMKAAKIQGKSPKELGDLALSKIGDLDFIDKTEFVNGFVNFWIKDEAIQAEAKKAYESDNYFSLGEKNKGKIIVEYSQPNIAKKMHVGHLRNTVFGHALANILEKSGYEVVRWNYIGDWGTQFGKLIAAYKMWGDEKKVKKNPIDELLKLYVKFHEEVKRDDSLEDKGRAEFQKLESGDEENRKLWEWFKEESLKEFEKLYETLGVWFDEEKGESFFENDMQPLIKELEEKGLAEESEGALIISLDKFNLPPALVRRGDGASLYLTRDIANMRYRLENYSPKKIIYVVGNEQSLHFEQLFAIAEILGLKDKTELIHAKYGLVLGEDGKKFATREGKTVLAEDIIEKAVALAKEVVEEKNPDIPEEEKNSIAKAVGIGALKYFLLRENKLSDIVFDWKAMMDFRGDSAPYLQYTYARTQNILKKAGGIKKFDEALLSEEGELSLMRKIMEFGDKLNESARNISTNLLTQYLFDLANISNRLYETVHILSEEDEEKRNARLMLASVTADILRSGMEILGIETPERV